MPLNLLSKQFPHKKKTGKEMLLTSKYGQIVVKP